MPVSYAETRNIVFPKWAVRSRSFFTERKEHMSRTIKAIERHMIPKPSRLQSESDSNKATARQATPPMGNGERKLSAEWQRGAEILGHGQRKLRLAFAPAQSPAFATLGH
jgi:hypothetical protein